MGSEMCIRDRIQTSQASQITIRIRNSLFGLHYSVQSLYRAIETDFDITDLSL